MGAQIEEMERLLQLFIDDQSRCHMSLSTDLMMTKAFSLYKDLHKKGYAMQEGNQFTASKDWFEWFKHHAILHNVKMAGEAASSDKHAADTLNGEAEKVEAEPQWGLTINIVMKVFGNIDEAMELLKEHYPNPARSRTTPR